MTQPLEVENAAAVPFPAPRGSCPFAPAPAYESARDELPLTKVTLYDGRRAWLVTRHKDARDVLSDPRFSADPHRAGFPMVSPKQKWILTGEPSFLRMDAPEHTRQRKALMSWFTHRRIETLRPKVQEFVDARIDAMTAGGSTGAELMSAFALPVPSQVISLILGVPYEDHEFFERTSQNLLRWDTTADAIAEAWQELLEYLRELAITKTEEPDGGILSHLVAEDSDLTLTQIASMARTVLAAGHDTTAESIGLSVVALLREPEKLAVLRGRPELYPGAIEELLRYLTPLGHHGIPRVATDDVVIDGVTVRAGEGVLCMLHVADRDGRVYENAGDLDVEGSGAHHLAFGHGIHLCLGAALARLELRIALETLFRRLPGLRLAVPFEELAFRALAPVHGLNELPVVWGEAA
ncbi:cytochrome P450 [Streptomyces sp. NPDC048629]|uniref:cytochrome P450 n=1 Tax=Streptomyces sp. NPDC048629 TaxID=3154824 RepID=UPI00343C394C